MNSHFSLFFGNGMIRYLYSKVNLWEGMYFFSMMEDKMIYQAVCFENMVKKGTGYFFKMGPGPIFGSLPPFLVRKR